MIDTNGLELLDSRFKVHDRKCTKDETKGVTEGDIDSYVRSELTPVRQ